MADVSPQHHAILSNTCRVSSPALVGRDAELSRLTDLIKRSRCRHRTRPPHRGRARHRQIHHWRARPSKSAEQYGLQHVLGRGRRARPGAAAPAAAGRLARQGSRGDDAAADDDPAAVTRRGRPAPIPPPRPSEQMLTLIERAVQRHSHRAGRRRPAVGRRRHHRRVRVAGPVHRPLGAAADRYRAPGAATGRAARLSGARSASRGSSTSAACPARPSRTWSARSPTADPARTCSGSTDGAAGNPLYLTELLDALARSAPADRHRRRCRGSRPSGPVPDSLLAAIRHRLDFLPKEIRTVLQGAALARRGVPGVGPGDRHGQPDRRAGAGRSTRPARRACSGRQGAARLPPPADPLRPLRRHRPTRSGRPGTGTRRGRWPHAGRADPPGRAPAVAGHQRARRGSARRGRC